MLTIEINVTIMHYLSNGQKKSGKEKQYRHTPQTSTLEHIQSLSNKNRLALNLIVKRGVNSTD